MDLIQKVQMKYANTDLSLAAMLPTPAPSFKKGPLTVRDMYSLYIYENTFFAIEVTGQQIKDELEWSAKYFNTYTYNTTATSLVNSSVAGYNYYMLQGADYVIDITKPVGERISGWCITESLWIRPQLTRLRLTTTVRAVADFLDSRVPRLSTVQRRDSQSSDPVRQGHRDD